MIVPLVITYTVIIAFAAAVAFYACVKMILMDLKERKAAKKDKTVREELDRLLRCDDDQKLVTIHQTNPNK